MDMRSIILEELVVVFNEDDLEIPEIEDDTLLLETEMDSLGFAVLVTRLEERLGYDPFSLMDEPVYPATFKEFVDVYEQFSSHAKPAS
jgi:acyl carrier protein